MKLKLTQRQVQAVQAVQAVQGLPFENKVDYGRLPKAPSGLEIAARFDALATLLGTTSIVFNDGEYLAARLG